MNTFSQRLALCAASVALAFSGSGCAHAETPLAAQVEQAAAAGPALWVVADEDTAIYLFGTVHTMPDDVDWQSAAVHDALAGADELVTEIDLTPEAIAKIPAIALSTGMFTDGSTVRSVMSGEDRARYETALTAAGIPVESFDALEPWLASLQLVQIAYQRAGLSPERGVEKILEAAVRPGTARIALETVEGQFAIFDELPLDAQVEYLIEAAEQFDEIGPFLDRVVDQWAAGDAAGLAEMLNQSMEGDAALAERLLYARNTAWAEWIGRRLDTPGTVFMAVGAGHLAGQRSVQDELAGRGIAVRRVQ